MRLATACRIVYSSAAKRLFIIKLALLSPQPQEYFLDAGGSESGLWCDHRKTSAVLHRLLSGVRSYQFDYTSDTAKIKDRGYIDDAKYLRSDAGNLWFLEYA